MIKHALVLTLLLSLAAAAWSASSGEVFVSPAGNDAWSGTLSQANKTRTDGPVATPAAAQQRTRRLREQNPGMIPTVTLRGGTYYLGSPLQLTAADSGVRWHAYRAETVVISGGLPLRGPWQSSDGRTCVTQAPSRLRGEFTPRLLRLGESWGIRARYPNFDPRNPYAGGWLFVKPTASVADSFGGKVANIHNAGDFLEWTVEVPATGDYSVFHYYGAQNEPFGRKDMGGRMTFTVDGGTPLVLEGFPDTGGWETFKWSGCNGMLSLKQGAHKIRWTNRDGGGLNYGAFALCDDPQWRPAGTPPAPPPAGKHLLVVQAAGFERSQGKELTVNFPASRRHFGFSRDELRPWPRSSDIEMHIFPAWGWVSTIEPIESLDLQRGVGTLAGREADQELRVGNRYYLENIAEELDAPNEWYLDRASGRLTWLAPDGAAARGLLAGKTPAVVPVLDRLIHLNKAVNVQFRGLTFMDTTYTPRIENAYYPPDAALWLENSSHCLIDNCRFTRLGGSAANLIGDSAGNRLLGSRVEYVGENGVFMDAPAGSGVFPSNNTIAGCSMQHLGLVYKHVAGVYIGQRDPALAAAPGNRIACNEIHDVPRYGVGIKMNQGNNVVEYNDIRNTNLETNDTGGIESCVRNLEAPGNIYRYNLVIDSVGMISRADGTILSPHFTWGIYMDDLSSRAQIIGNVCVRNTNGGVHIHGGRECLIENNILVDSADYQVTFSNIGSSMLKNIFRRNLVYRLKPGGRMITAGGFNPEVFASCDSNLYWQAGEAPALAFPLGPFADWQKAGYDANSLVADPLFVAPQKDDYRLRDDSPALKLGFRPIPVERIGLRGYKRADYPDAVTREP